MIEPVFQPGDRVGIALEVAEDCPNCTENVQAARYLADRQGRGTFPITGSVFAVDGAWRRDAAHRYLVQLGVGGYWEFRGIELLPEATLAA